MLDLEPAELSLARAMNDEVQKQRVDALTELAEAHAHLSVSPAITPEPPAILSASTPKLQDLVGTMVKMPFDVDVLVTDAALLGNHLLDLRNGTTRYFSKPEIAARCSQPALLDSALKPGAVIELWWSGVVVQATATVPTTQYRIQFEHGRVGEINLRPGNEALLDKYRVHSDSSALASAEPQAHKLIFGSWSAPVSIESTLSKSPWFPQRLQHLVPTVSTEMSPVPTVSTEMSKAAEAVVGAHAPAPLAASTFELIHRGLHSALLPTVVTTSQYGVLTIIQAVWGRLVPLPSSMGVISVRRQVPFYTKTSARIRAGSCVSIYNPASTYNPKHHALENNAQWKYVAGYCASMESVSPEGPATVSSMGRCPPVPDAGSVPVMDVSTITLKDKSRMANHLYDDPIFTMNNVKAGVRCRGIEQSATHTYKCRVCSQSIKKGTVRLVFLTGTLLHIPLSDIDHNCAC